MDSLFKSLGESNYNLDSGTGFSKEKEAEIAPSREVPKMPGVKYDYLGDEPIAKPKRIVLRARIISD